MLWEETGRNKVAPIGPVEEDMMQWVQHGPQWRGVMAWRGFGKTELITCTYAAFRILNDPNIKILIVSKSSGFATDAVRQVRDWMRTIWFLQHLAPEQEQDSSSRDRADSFDVANIQFTRHPTLLAVGIDGQLQGKRANLVIPDDIETSENSKTPESRAWLRRQANEFKAIASFGKGEIVTVGTPQHPDDSLYFHLSKPTKLSPRGVHQFRSWPARYPRPDNKLVGLSPYLQNRLDTGLAQPWEPVCPDRFPEEKLLRLADDGDSDAGISGGELWFLMQYMLVCDLAVSRRYPLRLADLIVVDSNPEMAPVSYMYGQSDNKGRSTAINDIPSLGLPGDALYGPASTHDTILPYQHIRAGIDPAGRGSDKTGIAIVARLGGFLHLLACYGIDGGAETERLDSIAQLLKLHNVQDVAIEENIDIFSQFENGLKLAINKISVKPHTDPAKPLGWNCSVHSYRSVRVQKELRIIGILEPLISRHRLVCDKLTLKPSSNDKNNELQYQIAHITRERKSLKEDGKIDALALACAQYQDLTKLDPESQANSLQAKSMPEILVDQATATLKKYSQRSNPSRYFSHRHFDQIN